MTKVSFKPGQDFSAKTRREMDTLHKNIRDHKTFNYSSFNEKLRTFYNSITDQIEWEVILLCLIYTEVTDKEIANSKYFTKSVEDLSYRIPMIPSGRNRGMQVHYLQSDIFSELSLDVRHCIKKALNKIIEDALFDNTRIIVEQCINWGRSEFEGIIYQSILKKIVCDRRIKKIDRWLAYFQITNKEGFQNKISSTELKDLCTKGGFKYSTYLSAVADKSFTSDADDMPFWKEVINFPNLAEKDLGRLTDELDSVRDAITYLITNNGDNVGFQTASSGIGLVASVYEKCCPKIKRLIQNSLKEIQDNLMLMKGEKTMVVYSLIQGAGLREFSRKEEDILLQLMLKKKVVAKSKK